MSPSVEGDLAWLMRHAALAVPGVAYASANYGRWVARCSHPYCYDAHELTRRPEMQAGFICEFGHHNQAVWPENPELIEEILLARPDVKTRNWEPGETTLTLLMENIAHGIPAVTHPEVGASASRLVLDASGGEVRLRLLDEAAVIDSAPDMPAIEAA